MDEAPEHESSSGYLRLPWQLVAGAVLLVLAVALGAGLIANRNLRERLTVPTATPEVAVAAPTAAPAITPTRLPTATAVQAATATAVRPTATSSTASASSTPVVVATELASPSTLPTVDPALADEIGQAYQRYWQVRAEAFLALDTSRLSTVMSGEHLAKVEAQIEQLRSEGRALETDVEHHFGVLEATNNHAWLGDNYVSNSVFVDSRTHVPLSEPMNGNVREFYEFERVDGEWKVVNLAGED
jgi:hypothetical protein